jgi:hypothetical protein
MCKNVTSVTFFPDRPGCGILISRFHAVEKLPGFLDREDLVIIMNSYYLIIIFLNNLPRRAPRLR